MPRCFMAKKLKYPYEQWKEQQTKEKSMSRSPSPNHMMSDPEDEDEEIDLVGLPENHANQTAARELHDVALKQQESILSGLYGAGGPPTAHQILAAHFGRHYGLLPTAPLPQQINPTPAHQRGVALTPPPDHGSKKKDLFRPYCLTEPRIKYEHKDLQAAVAAGLYPYSSPAYLQYRNIEDINTAHAILDLSRSSIKAERRSPDPVQEVPDDLSAKRPKMESASSGSSSANTSSSLQTPSPLLSPALSTNSADKGESLVFPMNGGKTTAYTYEAFFASDGRSRKKNGLPVPTETQNKPRYTCTECGKNYATSSNLSRHKQTHRSLDSSSAKKCHVCGKMYVSMPALSMHILTHNLNHKCDVCGKAFSRPWLLQGHMRSHSGDKPYGCAHCGKSFADRSNLRAHMQTHSAFKNFKCKRCNKSFALKSYLNKHYESACFKDQPIPSIDTPPVTPAPSDIGSDGGLASPGSASSISSSTSSSHPSPNGSTSSAEHHFGSLLSLLPSQTAQSQTILGV